MSSVLARSKGSWSAIQASFHMGVYLHNILYGIELYLYFKTMHILLVRNRARSRHDKVFAIFSTVMFVLVTIFVVIQVIFEQEQVSLLNPEERVTHIENSASYAPMDVSTSTSMALRLMTDGLMIYRCQVLWNSKRIIIIPAFLWLISAILGMLATWSNSVTATDTFSGIAYKFGMALYSISVFLQATTTSMICYRLVSHAKKMNEQCGKEYAAFYFSIIRLLVESVLPLTLTGIAFLISYGVGSPIENGLAELYIVLLSVSPQMLILRVAEGNAWEMESIPSLRPTVRWDGDGTDIADRGSPAPDIQLQSLPISTVFHPDSMKGNRV